jgi:membrane-associated phospholipid phosphatase
MGFPRASTFALLAGLCGFAALSADLLAHGPVYGADLRLDALMTHLTATYGGIHTVGQILSFPGDGMVDLFLVAAMCAWLAVRRQPRLAVLLAGGALAAAGLVAVLKPLFHRPLPAIFAALSPGDYGFPSGHTMGATAVVGLCILVGTMSHLERHPTSQWGWPEAIAAWSAIAIFTGLGRILSQTHWMGDVLAGWCLGTAVIATTAIVLHAKPTATRHPARGRVVQPSRQPHAVRAVFAKADKAVAQFAAPASRAMPLDQGEP